MVRPVFAFLLNPSSKTLLNLGQMAPGFGPLREDESGQVLAAGWIPGPRRRMLIWSQKSRHIIKLPDMTLPEGGVATFERKWLILDVDTRTSEIVSGLGPFHPETNYQSPSIIWSLDAQSVIIDGQQYALEPRM
jgi:hypothetical protein